MVAALALVCWPGAAAYLVRALAKILKPYDDSAFRAKDMAADETLPGWKRTIRELQYWLMMGIPIVLVVGVFVLGEFGKFFAMLFRGMFGHP
jgi:hypothetical protein